MLTPLPPTLTPILLKIKRNISNISCDIFFNFILWADNKNLTALSPLLKRLPCSMSGGKRHANIISVDEAHQFL